MCLNIQNQREWLSMRSVLTGTAIISTCSQDLQRQEKCSDSCTRLVKAILVLVVVTDDQPGTIVFSAVRKKFDIATQTLPKPPAVQETAVNSNQCNNTTEKNLEACLRFSTHCRYNICNII